MNGESGRVLVVDADYDVLGALSRSLRARGHQVVLAADGRTGLSRAVEVAADVVLVDQEVPVLDCRTFIEVLRDNPRTSSAHVFLMGAATGERMSLVDGRAEPILKPFNSEEVAARVDDVLRARLGPKREPELRGDLAQVALFDLLQVFAANRRTGRLELTTPGASGEVWVDDGRIVDATYAGVVGEKALYRILGVVRGRFLFVPGVVPERVRIDASTDQLLMEGARRGDEVKRLREELPVGSGAMVSLSIRPKEAGDLAQRVVAVLDEPRSIEEILDTVDAHDLEVLKALKELFDRSALLILDKSAKRVELVNADEAVALRSAAHRLRRPGLKGPVRLGVLARSATTLARFSRALSRVKEFAAAAQPPAAVGDGALGALGYIRLDGTDIELYALPLDAALRPVLGPILAPAQVAILLRDDQTDVHGVEAILAQLEVRLVEADDGWDRPGGAAGTIRRSLDAVAGRRSSAPPSSS